VKTIIQRKLANSKRRIERRLDKTDLRGCSQPMMTASNIHYEIGERNRGISFGGLGAIHALARRTGLIDAIDRRLELLKIHLPYHESDHVLALADHPYRPQAGLSLAGLEPVPADLLPLGGRVALLTQASLKSESGCSDPPWRQEQPCRQESDR
jgi:hypothetical protein